MVSLTRVIEIVVCTAFYSGLCYMLIEGTGMNPPRFGCKTWGRSIA
jgi:hypothetical protein